MVWGQHMPIAFKSPPLALIGVWAIAGLFPLSQIDTTELRVPMLMHRRRPLRQRKISHLACNRPCARWRDVWGRRRAPEHLSMKVGADAVP